MNLLNTLSTMGLFGELTKVLSKDDYSGSRSKKPPCRINASGSKMARWIRRRNAHSFAERSLKWFAASGSIGPNTVNIYQDRRIERHLRKKDK